MKMNTNEPVFDARQFGVPKMLVLGFQHMFAMFGATVLVPALTGLSVSATLLFAGLGTLLFHFLAKGKVPAFLGSSFAFLAGYAAIAPDGDKALLPYACLGVAAAALLYFVLAALVKIFGLEKVMGFFPPIVTGPIIIAIGLTLSSSAINNCSADWLVAMVAILIVVICNIWGKGMIKIIPIILGVVGSYLVGLLRGGVDIQAIQDAAWIGLPVKMSETVFSIAQEPDVNLILNAIITIMPIALATMIEHIGDMCAISSTVGKNYLADPGLHRTLCGDGAATLIASLFGAPANTTYGENTGVLSLTKVYDPRVIRIAAYLAIIFSFSPKFAAVVSSMPVATIGGVSLVLYGMISAVGVRNVVESRVDFTKSRNVIIAALILVLSIGIHYSANGAITIELGALFGGGNNAEGLAGYLGQGCINFSGLAVGALCGIVMNAILPGKDYKFENQPSEAAE